MTTLSQLSAARRFRPGAPSWRIVTVVGFVALALWAAWWAYSLDQLDLVGCASTWIRYPFFGADFTTQSDYAARLWAGGVDPYSFRDHLFHYPPIVIRLFLWTPLMSNADALRVWIVVLALLLIGGTLVSVHVRRKLPIEQFPASIALAAILFSFPAVFTMERANFDLITLAALLIAFWLLRLGKPWADVAAGCILAVGPWVKLYPGIMGLGLVALRRWKTAAGFVVAGIAIGLWAPAETLRSFEVLHIAVERIKLVSKTDPLPPWSHSLSVAWQDLAQLAQGTPFARPLAAVPGDLAGAAFVLVLAGWVSLQLYRLRNCDALLYPLLLWLNALGSCVGAIANDYSLMFLPLAIVAVVSLRDPLFVRVSLGLLLLWWQPIDLRLPPVVLFVIKLLALVAVGISLVRRARELSGAEALSSAPAPDRAASSPPAQCEPDAPAAFGALSA